MVALVCDVILFGSVNLYLWILRVDLPLNEALQRLRRPDVELNASANRGNFKAEVFLVSAIRLEFARIAQNTVQARKHLFGGEL